nr:hypothetical protein 21 [bacterium]
MYTIQKTFTGYPFAHRQHRHDGHCAFVHGHNWEFTVVMESPTLDENGFVFDFGKFKKLKEWFNHMFDHTLLINEDDPHLEFFQRNSVTRKGYLDLWDLRIVKGGSAELLAEFIFKEIWDLYPGYKVVKVIVREDEKNEAVYANK